jgi:hypothetical protein
MTTTKSNKAKADAFFGREPIIKDSTSVVEITSALNWLRTEQTPELNKKWLIAFMKQNNYTKSKIETVMSNLRQLSSSWYSVARILTNGSNVPANTKQRLDAALDSICSGTTVDDSNLSSNKVAKPRTTSVSVSTEVLEYIDLLIEKSKTGNVDEDVYAFLMDKKVTKNQVDELIAEYKLTFDELNQLSVSEEIQESYADYTPKQRKSIQTFFNNMYAQFDQYKNIKSKRAKTVRKTRKPDKQKLISKLKYLKESTEYRIASVDPAKLLGAKTAVTFNTKTREVSIFYGVGDGISVKGTTLVGFDKEKSVSKRLRKPNDVLSHGVRAGLENAFAAAKTKSKAANGRMNENIIIVKVWN